MESPEGINITLLIIIGCAAMTLLAGFIIFFVVLYQKKAIIQRNEVEAIKFKHQQELLEKTLDVEEKERERIAKNIHDDLGALISILRLNNSRASKNVKNQEILDKINKENTIILNRTSESVRSISKKLVSPTLIKLGFVKALKELCQSFTQTGEIAMTFSDHSNGNFAIESQKASHLFRASQEIINNIVKHAGASNVSVEILNLNASTSFTITFIHDGKGISSNDVSELTLKNKGLGLISIQSRLTIINANITYFAAKNEAAKITITYQKNEEKN